jgi:hypothetical protein
MNKKWKIAFAILGMVLFIPFPTSVIPEWTIILVDENNHPYQNSQVRQFCYNYSLGVDACKEDSDKLTDDNGNVKFPDRVIEMSLIARIIYSTANFIGQVAHGSYGTRIYFDANGPQGNQILQYEDNLTNPTRFVLKSK